MTVVVKQVGDQPIVVATIYEPVDMAVDPQKNRDECNAIARKFKSKVYRIIDFTHFELTFDQLTIGLAEDIRLSEPNIVLLIVGKGDLIELQRDATKQAQYGGREAYVFNSVDEAIAFANQQIQG